MSLLGYISVSVEDSGYIHIEKVTVNVESKYVRTGTRVLNVSTLVVLARLAPMLTLEDASLFLEDETFTHTFQVYEHLFACKSSVQKRT